MGGPLEGILFYVEYNMCVYILYIYIYIDTYILNIRVNISYRG